MSDRESTLKRIREAAPVIGPSLLKCDFGNMHREIASLETAGAQILHLDVMDGHFVPNLTYGPPVIARWRDLTELIFDAHLMIERPARYWREYVDAGCDCITVHLEAVPQPADLLEQIRAANCVSGLAINPGTPVDRVIPFLKHCDQVLVMSVEPGFGGQEFLPSALEKLRELNKIMLPGTILAVDGGIGRSTIQQSARAGATVFITGSALFSAQDYSSAINELRQLAQQTG